MAVKAKWVDGLQFVGTDDRKQAIVMDASTGGGGEGSGIRPPDLVLLGLAGCTGIDIVNILRKGRHALTGLEVEAYGENTPEAPWGFAHISVRYVVKGRGLSEEAVKRAIQLSEEKYCSVRASLSAEMDSSYVIQEAEGPEAV